MSQSLSISHQLGHGIVELLTPDLQDNPSLLSLTNLSRDISSDTNQLSHSFESLSRLGLELAHRFFFGCESDPDTQMGVSEKLDVEMSVFRSWVGIPSLADCLTPDFICSIKRNAENEYEDHSTVGTDRIAFGILRAFKDQNNKKITMTREELMNEAVGRISRCPICSDLMSRIEWDSTYQVR